MPFLPRNPEHHTEAVHAMYRTSLEHPFSDTVHLVYADAMDDAGAHEEASTLRRLVKLRAAIGTKPTHVPRAGEAVGDLAGKLLVTNEAEESANYDKYAKDKHIPHVAVPDSAAAPSDIWMPQRFNRSSRTQTRRVLTLDRKTGGAVISHTPHVSLYEPRRRTPTGGHDHLPMLAFIHSDDVKHLLGETDA